MLKFPAFHTSILFEDDNLIVVNKPPLLPSLDERVEVRMHLLSLARQYDPAAQLCHRLDKETSGALIIARNEETYRHISMQFQNREVRKEYHAVAEGVHKFENFEIDLPLSAKNARARVDKRRGKSASTVFNTLEHFRHFTLLQALPVTGRFHQIRAHLQSVKAPIAADPAYGGQYPMLSQVKRGYRQSEDQEEKPIMRRVALHALSLRFKNLAGDEIQVEAPYPPDFATFLKLLRKYDSLSI